MAQRRWFSRGDRLIVFDNIIEIEVKDMIRRWRMKKTGPLIISIVFFVVALLWGFQAETRAADGSAAVKLPRPVFEGTVSVEKALKERRSVRAYKAEPLAMSDVAK